MLLEAIELEGDRETKMEIHKKIAKISSEIGWLSS
jgi:hypothetical protein